MDIKKLFSSDGRLNRKPYWLQTLGIYLWYGIVFGIATGVELPILRVLVLPVLWISIMVLIKRFHDLGRSGWHYFMLMIPFYNIWVIIQLSFFRGTVGENKFGPDPLGGTAPAAADQDADASDGQPASEPEQL